MNRKELLVFGAEMSVGEKRNKLIHMAKGEYFSFIDDDDLVSEECYGEGTKTRT